MMVFLAILAIASMGAWIFIVYRSFSLKADIAILSVQADEVQARDARTQSLKVALRDSRASITLINNRFVTKDGAPAFIDLLEVRAREAGVKVELDSLNFDQTLRVHILGTGSWRNNVGYLSLLESLPYAIRVDNLSFSKIGPQSTGWSMSLDLTVLVAPNSQNQ